MDQLPPLLEYDPDSFAILNPRPPRDGSLLPVKAVPCFFQDVITALLQEGQLEEVGELRSEMGRNPLYRILYAGQSILVFHPGIGASFAAAFLEEVIARGTRQFIACGGCGVLRADIAAGHPVVLASAVRDEGTSYHYLPPGREVSAHPAAVTALQSALSARDLPYLLGKSWTTDGYYRETAARRARRLAEGCDVVEMEAAAFFAVAHFRAVTFGQIVYGGDLVVPEGWDLRAWHQRRSDRHLLFQIALEACALL